MADRARARREGRRWNAFYQGCRACRVNRPDNPHKPGTESHACWEAGWKYAEGPKASSPVCRFGPGGDYVRNWPDAEGER